MAPPVRPVGAPYHFHAYDFANSQAWRTSSPQPERGGLSFYSMKKDLDGLETTGRGKGVPNINLYGESILGTDTDCKILALSFGGNADAPEVAITGGIHAREWVAPEMAYLLAEYLIVNYPDPGVHNPNRYQQVIKDIVDNRRIHIIPMLNPAGNVYSVFDPGQGARMWRRNRRPLPTTANEWREELWDLEAAAPRPPFRNVETVENVTSYQVPRYAQGKNATKYDTIKLPNAAPVGVDLNRNFPTKGFGHGCAPDFDEGVPGEDTYFGPGAASEFETRIVQALLRRDKELRCSIDYHSYGKYILYPGEACYAGKVDASYTALGQILQRLIGPLSESWWDYDYRLGTPMSLLGYDGVGTLDDWIALRNPARAFTVELDPRGGNGFQLPENQIQTVFEKNVRGALALLEAAGQASTVQNVKNYYVFNRRTITSGEREFLDWNVFDRGNRLPA